MLSSETSVVLVRNATNFDDVVAVFADPEMAAEHRDAFRDANHALYTESWPLDVDPERANWRPGLKPFEVTMSLDRQKWKVAPYPAYVRDDLVVNPFAPQDAPGFFRWIGLASSSDNASFAALSAAKRAVESLFPERFPRSPVNV